VPVTSLEEPEAGQANYACCTFRGFVAALDAVTGKEIWKTYTIPEAAKVIGKNSQSKDMLAPAGAGVWVTPTLDVRRRAVYVATGNAFSGTPSTANAVMAFNMDTGKVLWTMQALALDVWHNGCVQNVPGRGGGRGRGGAPQAHPPQPASPPFLRVAAAVDAATHTHRITVLRRIFSVLTGTSALLRHLHGCLTDVRSSSHRRNRDSSGQSILTTDK
jgi:hypothetical protein